MKILEANAGALTNFEVLDLLRSRGASKDATRVLAQIAQSEFEEYLLAVFQVYDHLEESISRNQTRLKINEFVEKCKRFKLAKAEVLNIINVRPSSPAEIFAIIEQAESRFEDEQLQELVDLVTEVLPPLTDPELEKTEERNDKNKEGTATGEQVDEDQQQPGEGEIEEGGDISHITADDEAMDDS
ncbi:hypothetical protein Dsin_029688 [Dipteronia sinensis]|uniref:DNA-directed RNA polymerase III subunit RPC9 n=1 Tax=Dipteronia sinensis TaxID=43782 RepID=A0AAD9ZT59_9ROSI|nr:hypothetical protein Dsin_029688 [Dipteronia sinensis]